MEELEVCHVSLVTSTVQSPNNPHSHLNSRRTVDCIVPGAGPHKSFVFQTSATRGRLAAATRLRDMECVKRVGAGENWMNKN